MNALSAVRFSDSRARNASGEFSPQGETTPGGMARAYLPLRLRLVARSADRLKARVTASNTTALDKFPLDLSRRLTPVQFAIIRQFGRVRAAREGRVIQLDRAPIQEREQRRTDRTIRNIGIGVGALGVGYGAWRVGQLAKSSQAAADAARQSADAVSTAAREGVKAARSTRMVAARGYLALKNAKRQLTTFPTFKRILT